MSSLSASEQQPVQNVEKESDVPSPTEVSATAPGNNAREFQGGVKLSF